MKPSVRKAAPLAVRSAIAASLIALLGAGAALAYIPSAASLLRRAAARVSEGGRSKEATLTGTLTVGGQLRQATLKLRFPLGCVLESGGLSASAARSRDGATMQMIDNGLGPDALDLLRFACPLVAYRGQTPAQAEQSLRSFLSSVGVAPPFAPTSLARLYDRVAIVLGASARQLDRPQLWLYKDNGAPARLLALSNGTLDDLRLLQYGNPAAADWLPRMVELWRGPALRARFEALESRGLNDADDIDDTGSDDPRE